MTRRRVVVAAFLVLVAQGCTDTPAAPTRTAEVPRYAATTRLRGTVDAHARTLTFAPVPLFGEMPIGAAPIAPQIYGDQGVTVQLYNSPVTITNPSSPGKKTFSADVGLRNLRLHPIGDEQNSPAPLDIMGIYVFVNAGPTVAALSSPCPTCTVTVKNAHGVLPFFGVQGQPYWHWPERLTEFVPGPGAGDTTFVRRAWVFEADTQVVLFSFDVLVSAAWPPPNETRWRVEFPGDSIPDLTAEPIWRLTNNVGTVSLNDPSPGIFTVTTPDGGVFHAFVRFDTLASTSNAYMDVFVRRNAPLNELPEISFGMDDDMKFVAVGLSGTHVGFLTGTFEFLGTPVAATTTAFHRYQIRKFGADSVQLRMDDVRIASASYASFPATLQDFPFGFFWGGVGSGFPPVSSGGNSSSWDHVIYEIGVSIP